MQLQTRQAAAKKKKKSIEFTMNKGQKGCFSAVVVEDFDIKNPSRGGNAIRGWIEREAQTETKKGNKEME